VRRPHGVRGEVRLDLLTDYPERVVTLANVYLASDVDGSDAAAYAVEGARRHQGELLLLLAGITDRDQAGLLRDKWVLVAMQDAVPLEDGEFYLFQLVGLEVVTDDGETLGLLQDVIETGANDVYVVSGGERGEVLIPAIPSVVQTVDLEARRVTVVLPAGLLPD
jgi:16S rRNA processing protein RimM